MYNRLEIAVSIYIYISINITKTSFLSRKRAITTFLSQKFMIMQLLMAFEGLLGSSIAPQVMTLYIEDNFFKLGT